MPRTLNLGILAHVDAGKTSLTERLLYDAGVIDTLGRVDDGSTQTDSLALERLRGITIRSAVVSFVVGEVTINLIDTPGHPDFIAEVERVLGVLDGAVLVISAVEGVQAQTRVLIRTLQRLRIPTVLFINKIDRAGADPGRVAQDVADTLTQSAIPMGTVRGAGTRAATFTPYAVAHQGFSARLVELLAGHSDAVLAAYVEDEERAAGAGLRDELARQAREALVHPVYFGSAITGAGVDSLIAGATALLPGPEPAIDGPAEGTVFKVERGPAGEKLAFLRMFAGTLRTRDRLPLRDGVEQKVTAIEVFDGGGVVRRAQVTAGEIARVSGLGSVRVGDTIGARPALASAHYFAAPTLETVVAARNPADRAALREALAQLEEQDPLIHLRQDDERQELSVSLYGEVQKEVIAATLAEDYGVDVTFRESSTICIERPVGSGAAEEVIGVPPNPFLATVGLRVDPAPIGSGVEFRLEVELGSMPLSLFRAVEEAVKETLRQGIHGWTVTDCTVTMTRSGYWPRQSHAHATFDKTMSSTAGDFRQLTPLVLMSALRVASTRVCEPLHRFDLEVPADSLAATLAALSQLRGVPRETAQRGRSFVLTGEIPAARVHELQMRLPGLTSGEGVLLSALDHYQPVPGPPPSRPRSDLNPLNRTEYLKRLARR